MKFSYDPTENIYKVTHEVQCRIAEEKDELIYKACLNAFETEKGEEIVINKTELVKALEHWENLVRCKDCKHWKEFFGSTEHVKMCDVGKYAVGENGYCVYGDMRTSAE
jgi:hypothetical protein